MKPHKTMKRILLLPLLTLLLAACHSTQTLTKDTTKHATESAADAAYKKKVAANAQTTQYLTAHVKVSITADGKDLSCNGTLRMKRNDVIQLSLSMLGFELGRLECTPKDVLVVDRYNKQYVRAGYDKVSFLAQAGLDFYTLQSLFWNELFVPGETDVTKQLARFSLSSAGDHTLLALKDAPKLEYDFLTKTESGLVDRLTAYSKQVNEKGQFVFKYSNFGNFNGKKFPQQMELSITGTGKDVSLSIALSRLDTKKDWETRTELSSKYKQRTVEAILGRLMSAGL